MLNDPHDILKFGGEEGETVEPDEVDEDAADNNTASDEQAEKLAKTEAATVKETAEADALKAGVDVQVDGRLEQNSAFVKTMVETGKRFGLTDSEVTSLKEGTNELLGSIKDKIDKEGMTYEEALESVQDEAYKNLDSIIKDKAGRAAVEKFNKQNTDALYSNLKKVNAEAADAFVEKLNKELGGKFKTKPPDMTEFYKKLDKITSDMGKEYSELKKKFEDSQQDGDAKDASEGKSPRARLSFEQWMKVLGILLTLGGIAGGLFAWIEYCKNHSGCMKVDNDGNNPQTSVKIICAQDSKGNNTGYLAQKCRCLKTSAPSPGTCASPSCASSKDTPTPEMCGAATCKNFDSLKPPYRYYTFQIMGPVDGLLDIGSRVVDLATGGFGKIMAIIIKVLKVVGFIILGLGILYLIIIIAKGVVKHVKNKKNSTSSA